jgi:hypothetical protein
MLPCLVPQGFEDDAEDDAEEIVLEGVDPTALQATVYTGSIKSSVASGGGVIADRKGNLYTPAMFPDKPVVSSWHTSGGPAAWGLCEQQWLHQRLVDSTGTSSTGHA